MSRGRHLLFVICFLLVITGLSALIIWQAKTHNISLFYITGTLCIALGAIGTLMRLTMSDESLRRHLGEGGADWVRQLGREGWFGIVFGAVMIAAAYFLGLGR